jgi:hypothetical protein
VFSHYFLIFELFKKVFHDENAIDAKVGATRNGTVVFRTAVQFL